jgi:hypothetical protein
MVEKTVRRAPCEHDPSHVGSVPRTDRLGNGPYIGSQEVIQHGFKDASMFI